MSLQEPAVVIRGMNKFYGGYQALKEIDLDVALGEKAVICGPSGSGKSTLIRCINRLEEHDGGSIAVFGRELDDRLDNVDAVRREAGMVFQHFNLFPHLTVIDNCMLAPLCVRRLSRRAARERAMACLARVHIADQADKYPGQLSGGQQQRVAIARALCMEPRMILFDEPTSALDPEMISEVLEVMVTLARDGMTMICVTHEMGFARQVADRVVFMADGRVVEQADPARFFSDPATPRARTFLSQLLNH
ncbi:MAG: glutamine ABC transporter ATP-binding protein [Tistrella sp.]|nr:amino acid ABC transporter ATP-binding protein [uncultured Tistrella sp.]MAM74845.1 glutamine ABC transporter ATP-binding protein [Tistrella sp.]|tara:strand:- start:514 stop:1260 length:747 start_codon:yes stop_codon:yes gene_type:complete